LSTPALDVSQWAIRTSFADPYKKCAQCGRWVDGTADVPGPLALVPCGHRSEYVDVCPSWGPVDGCGCASYNAGAKNNPGFEPIVHDMRPRPLEDDAKVY
jgi:hypothetical protein